MGANMAGSLMADILTIFGLRGSLFLRSRLSTFGFRYQGFLRMAGDPLILRLVAAPPMFGSALGWRRLIGGPHFLPQPKYGYQLLNRC
jgi:hypothetical protein